MPLRSGYDVRGLAGVDEAVLAGQGFHRGGGAERLEALAQLAPPRPVLRDLAADARHLPARVEVAAHGTGVERRDEHDRDHARRAEEPAPSVARRTSGRGGHVLAFDPQADNPSQRWPPPRSRRTT